MNKRLTVLRYNHNVEYFWDILLNKNNKINEIIILSVKEVIKQRLDPLLLIKATVYDTKMDGGKP
jgi:hypothetical protein